MFSNTEYKCKPPFTCTVGPKDASIVLVGEAFGENEEALQAPFVGWSGYELSKMCFEAGLVTTPPLEPSAYSNMMLMDWWARTGLLLTNTLALRPPDNKLELLCGKKAEVKHGLLPFGKGGYLLDRYLPELDRLAAELGAHPRTCVIAIGATASWALMGQPGITKVRGVASAGQGPGRGLKILPTYHPAGVLRNWSWRPIAVADLMKVAIREGGFSEIRRPEREVIINPDIAAIRAWLAKPTHTLGVDIETKNRQIEMVGLARSRDDAIVIPFIDTRKRDKCYWPTHALEVEAWWLLRGVLENPAIAKVFQNGLYDLQYFLRKSPIRPRSCSEDTMLLHHALFPELQKSLGFMGSLYTNESSWKLWRGMEQEDLKRDE